MNKSEYPGALWIPADKSNYLARDRDPSDIKNIVIHITSGRGDPRPTAEMWQQPGHGSSAHFVIGQDGTVVQAVALNDVAYHAHAANASSIGIEHCAREPGELGHDDPGLPVSDAQMAASAKLVRWLLAVLFLPSTRTVIQGHCEIDKKTSHADCPIACIDLDAFVAEVEAQVVPA